MRPVRLAPRSKYGVNQSPSGKLARTVDGITFASLAEAKRYGELKLLERAGTIRQLRRQPWFELVAGGRILGKYIADFEYLTRVNGLASWVKVYEDVKGHATPLYKWKKKHVEAQESITIREIRR